MENDRFTYWNVKFVSSELMKGLYCLSCVLGKESYIGIGNRYTGSLLIRSPPRPR